MIYQGIRLTPEQIVAAAVAEDVHCVGLSILSGSHMELVPQVVDGCARPGWTTYRSLSAASFRTPTPGRSARLGWPRSTRRRTTTSTGMMSDMVDVIRRANGLG